LQFPSTAIGDQKTKAKQHLWQSWCAKCFVCCT